MKNVFVFFYCSAEAIGASFGRSAGNGETTSMWGAYGAAKAEKLLRQVDDEIPNQVRD